MTKKHEALRTVEDIQDEIFTLSLREYLKGMTVTELLKIPGVYNIVSEHFNNNVIESIEYRGLMVWLK